MKKLLGRRQYAALALGVVVIVLVGVSIRLIEHVQRLNGVISTEFELRGWGLPSRVYARALELHPDLKIAPEAFEKELELLHYHLSNTGPGSYRREGSHFTVHTRGVDFSVGAESEREVEIKFSEGSIKSIKTLEDGKALDTLSLEPLEIGAIYPSLHEDRVLVKLDEVPQILIDTVIAVEDRRFYHHSGVDILAILRSMWANLRAQETIQGGSTLTQQLVRNLFLTNERTLTRKMNEAIISVLLEWRYDKKTIIETYINEIYLGQNGARAIHGFALASQFYFQRQLKELFPDQIAVLVALLKGPSYYSPTRNPERALERRNVVLGLMAENGVIPPEAEAIGKSKPLGVTEQGNLGLTLYPAYMDLVRGQLLRDYSVDELRTVDLTIHTAMDPILQSKLEAAGAEQLERIESEHKKSKKKSGDLEVAALIADKKTGEVLAVLGGRDPRYAGYNRALDAQRPIGSLVKPAIYLTALMRADRYTLATLIDDSPLQIKQPGQKRWAPANYDKKNHGFVTLTEALVKSHNVATARLGLDVGVPAVINTLQKLGFERAAEPYPSLLLGALEMSVAEVSQIYQTLAAGGRTSRLSVIRGVQDREGRLLQHEPVRQEQVIDATAAYLIVSALQEVTKSGTAASLQRLLPKGFAVAGKTGTTDEFRDSWFAGFSGQHVGVVWVGTDDNTSTGLTGSNGALPIWAQVMKDINTQPLLLNEPGNVEWQFIDPHTGLLADSECEDLQLIPFVTGSAPYQYGYCGEQPFQVYGDDGRAYEGTGERRYQDSFGTDSRSVYFGDDRGADADRFYGDDRAYRRSQQSGELRFGNRIDHSDDYLDLNDPRHDGVHADEYRGSRGNRNDGYIEDSQERNDRSSRTPPVGGYVGRDGVFRPYDAPPRGQWRRPEAEQDLLYEDSSRVRTYRAEPRFPDEDRPANQ